MVDQERKEKKILSLAHHEGEKKESRVLILTQPSKRQESDRLNKQ